MKAPLALICLALLLGACTTNNKNNNQFDTITLQDLAKKKQEALATQKDTDTVKISPLEDSIQAIGNQVLQSLKNQDFPTFASFFHPKGVRFSPYGFIDVQNAKTLTQTSFLASIAKNWTLTWGVYDGTGQKIQLKVIPYLNQFVYNADYLQAEKIGINQQIGKGNSPNNIANIYPNGIFIEYHFSGLDKQHQGMDWTSLRLVFEKLDGNYYLVAVIHDQWTT